MGKRQQADDYESDGGFVEDAPRSKKAKVGRPVINEMQTDDEGNEFWEVGTPFGKVQNLPLTSLQLSGKRRVQISDFKGTTMVGIREFYEKDGKILPGKKVGEW